MHPLVAPLSSEHFKFSKARNIKIFSQKLGKTNKRTYNFRDSARLQYPFYCSTRTIERPKKSNNIIRWNRFDIPGGQFLILLFLVGKIDWVSHPVISLKEMNKKVSYAHFKMKGLLLLKQLLLPGDFMFKINLKETYFALSLSNNSRNVWGSDGKA